MEIIIIIILMHVVGDHVFQWAGLSLKKRSEFLYLLLHTFIYSAILTVFSFFLLKFTNNTTAIYYILFNIVLHFVVDFFTGMIKKKFWDSKSETAFFTVASVDQILHLAILLTSYIYLTDKMLF